MAMRCLYFLLILILSYCLSAQDAFNLGLDKYVFDYKQEKVYLHLDKPQYAAGEDVWLKAYVTNATSHLPTAVSSTLHVELIDQKQTIVDSLTLFIKNGVSHGSFSLLQNTQPGNYQVRAYTNWMRNTDSDFFFTKSVRIVNAQVDQEKESNATVDQKLRIDFLPEGGDLIDGIPTKVAVKATDFYGKGLAVEGKVVNSAGDEITRFTCNEFGYSVFFIDPTFGETYSAHTEKDTFKLPTVNKKGASIQAIHHTKSDYVHIAVLSQGVDLTNGTLVVHRRGELLYTGNSSTSASYSVRLKKSQLKPGIIHLTFFDKHRIPLSERLIFPNPPIKESGIKILSGRKAYKERSKVTLELRSALDSVHSASLTVNPLTESSYEAHDQTIVNYLLLDSDLKGTIESPGFYFTGTREAYQALDLLMLTHGWSRFDWNSLLREEEFAPRHLAEEGITINGKAINLYTEKNLKEPLLGITIPALGVLNETFSIGEDGTFQLAGLQLMDSTSIYLQAFREKGEKTKKYRSAQITLENPIRPDIGYQYLSDRTVNQEFVKKAATLKKISEAYFLDPEATQLEEVVVSAKSYAQEEMDKRTMYAEPSNRVIVDSVGMTPMSVFDLLRQVPGVTVTGIFPNQLAYVRNVSSFTNNTPAYFIDGIPVDSSFIQTIPIEIVEFVDVLKGARAALYGSRGANGVILVYTRRGGLTKNKEKSTGLLAFTHPGYHQSKEFYSPQYDVASEEDIVPDFRTTLYWNPELNFKKKRAEMTFFTSDQTGDFTIRVEGMYANGEPFFVEGLITVK